MLLLLTKEKHYTVADYERLPEGAPYQLIGGELVMSPSPLLEHQRIIWKLSVALGRFIEEHQLGELILSPMDVFLTDNDVYQPDLIFVGKAKVPKLNPKDRIRLIPDLVVEVLSPSTGSYDYSRKKRVYCEQGVQEYWIIDPEERTIEIMVKQDKLYQTTALLGETGIIQSAMFPGFSLKADQIFS
jgi:Uma2 family endonuclease